MKRSAPVLIVFLAALVVLPLSAQAGTEEDLDSYLDPDSLRGLLLSPPEGFFLVDVRSEAEYVTGHIPGAVNAEYSSIAENLPTDDRDALMVVYCRSGRRSSIAAATLTELGFSRVVDWGGIVRWPYPLVGGPEPGSLE